MYRTTLVFPVLPGKSEADITRIGDRFKNDPNAYLESRARAGVTLERAYRQHTPMGDFVVGYAESDRNAGDVIRTYAEGATELDRFFIDTVKEVHGVDITAPPAGPLPETVGEWVDTTVTDRGRGLAFCAPIIPGQEDRGRAWVKETFASQGMTTSRRAFHQNVEVVTLTITPDGSVIGVYLEGADPVATNRTFAASTEPFDVSFKEMLATLIPPFVDFNKPLTGIDEIFDSLALKAMQHH
ncbi:hypothetical protein [Pengzhenrongella sp.]|jgi:hypothetical protein|uniref:hypothetical protein n=1 Tax=Pengzhenrongella sp. TaxID=2888820 RepID=UPI002F939C2C